MPENEARPVVFEQPRGLLADPQTAADVARIFGKRVRKHRRYQIRTRLTSKQMNKFFIYKEYGAKYDMMTTDITSAHASMPDWESYQRGLEALASTVGSSKTGADELKKSLSLADLLMKVRSRNHSRLHLILILPAYPKDMQISAALFRASEAHYGR